MPRSSLQTLEQICIRSICINWEVISALVSRSDITTFAYLPESILNTIKKRLLLWKNKKLNLFEFLLFTLRKISTVNLKECYLTERDVLHVLCHLQQLASNIRSLTLTNLVVSHGIYWQPKENFVENHKLLLLLESLTNLVHLNLEKTQCQDWMLNVIAENCTKLCELNITNCLEVTDAGISTLCRSSAKFNTHGINLCKIWFAGTNTSCGAVMEVLNSFPSLNVCAHTELLTALQRLFLVREVVNLEISTPFHLMEDLTAGEQIVHLVPHIDTQLWNIPSSLTLFRLTSYFNPFALSNFTNLRKLMLSFCKGVDKLYLSSIATNFPNLQHLELYFEGQLKFSVHNPLQNDAFRSLETLIMHKLKTDSLSSTNASLLLTKCVSLKKLHINTCPWLSDKILDDILYLNPLKNLRQMTLLKTKLSVDGVSCILNMKNDLEELMLSSSLLGVKQHRYFMNYVRQKNLNLILKLHKYHAPS